MPLTDSTVLRPKKTAVCALNRFGKTAVKFFFGQNLKKAVKNFVFRQRQIAPRQFGRK